MKAYSTLKNKALYLLPVVSLALAGSARAEGEPINLTSAGSTLVGYVTTAAGAAVVIFVAILGIRWMIRAFKTVK